MNLKNSKARDYEDLQIGPIKFVIDILAPFLVHIYNLSFATGVFPSNMKIAKVIVLSKGGNPNELRNYRPISLLPVFSKGLEVIVNKRLTKFFEKHRSITNLQFGFRKLRSTEIALLHHKEHIIQNIERKLFTLGIYIDLSKAFDSLNHSLLLAKLEKYGIRGVALSFFRSYLTSRQQYVSISTSSSDKLKVHTGVPQGSILGPLLFNMYINDIVNIASDANFYIYADDTTVFVSDVDIEKVIAKANTVLQAIHQWTKANYLVINTKKTKAVLYRPKNKLADCPVNIRLGENYIDVVKSVKVLGVYFSANLSWDAHISYVRSRISRPIGIMNRLRHTLPKHVKILLYNSLIFSTLRYCLLVWGTANTNAVKGLLVTQKRAIRIIADVPYDHHTQHLFTALNFIKITYLYKFLLLKAYLSAVKHNNECMLSLVPLEWFPPYSRHSHLLKIPLYRTNYGHQSLSYTLPSTLNFYHMQNINIQILSRSALRALFVQST